MADVVTRAEFDALAARVTALDGGGKPPVPVPAPADTVTVATPSVTVAGLTYTLTGVITPAKAATFTFLQLAVRGPGATDQALSPNTALKAGESKTLTASVTGQAGDFTAWVAYSLDGTTWVDGPKRSFSLKADPASPPPVTPPATGRKVPLVGRSKLPFNSLVFRQTQGQMEGFGSRRGVPMDGLLYFTGRQKWDDFRWHPEGQKDMLAAGLIVVTSMPHAPESEGDQMNQRGADNAYKGEQVALGKWLADNGFNAPTHCIRVDWEANGSWYKWSANRPGGAAALKQAVRNYVTNLRAGGLTKVHFNQCYNKGPNQAGAAFEFYAGPEYVDVIGMDQYDMWAPSYTASDWEREMAKPPSVRTVAKLARDNGVMWSWDEGGNTHGDSNQGGDNPKYWEFVRAEIQKNIANCAWHNTYDDPGAPATLMHDFARNPKSWAEYLKQFKPA